MKKSVYRERNNQPTKLDVVIYTKIIYPIGGIETWLYYVTKRYNVGQITVLYEKADAQQLRRLNTAVETLQYTGQEIECNKIIFAAPIYMNEVLYNSAKERYLINHCNYGDTDNTEVFELPELDGIFAVSKICTESCKKRMASEILTLYNPVEIEKPKKVLKLVTASRMSKKKGSEQMLKFAKMLDEAGISFMWFIFTDTELEGHHPNMFFMPPRMDLASVIAGCDYGVQFTCNESFGLFPVECLKCGTPVIVTDLPVFREIGIDEKNAFFYDWDMNGADVKELLNIPKVKYKAPNSDKLYKELLSSGILQDDNTELQ